MRALCNRFFGAAGLWVPEKDFCLADGFCIGQQLGAIKGWQRASHHKAVRHAAGGKTAAPENAHLDRAVHQLVVVGGYIGAKALFVDVSWCEAGRG